MDNQDKKTELEKTIGWPVIDEEPYIEAKETAEKTVEKTEESLNELEELADIVEDTGDYQLSKDELAMIREEIRAEAESSAQQLAEKVDEAIEEGLSDEELIAEGYIPVERTVTYADSDDEYGDLSDEALAAEGYVQRETRKERRERKKREKELTRQMEYVTEDEPTRSYTVADVTNNTKAIRFDDEEYEDEDDEYEYVTPHYGLNAFMLTLLFAVIGAVTVFVLMHQSMAAEIRQIYLDQGYMLTKDAFATSNDIAEGKTAYVNGKLVTGTYVDINTSTATATAGDILRGYTAYVNGVKITGNIPTFPLSAYYIPSTKDITIPKGYYIADDIIIQGDSNLLAKNIKKGVTIFKVAGSYE